ncbi:disintegrin and metallopeptidase domain 21 [Cricetulus griseus]
MANLAPGEEPEQECLIPSLFLLWADGFIMLDADAEALMRVTLLLLCLKVSLSPNVLSKTGSTQYLNSPEVVIPLKVTSRDRGTKNSGWLSYSLVFGGQRHVVHMRVKNLLVSIHFSVLTYSEEHALLKDYPFVPSDCYYHGFVEGVPESLVAFSACNGGFQGVLQMNGFSYEIQPIRHSSTFEHLVYTLNNNKTQFPPMMCGLTEKRMPYQHFQLEDAERSAVKQNSVKLWTHTWFLELAVVVDYGFFTYCQRNLSKVQEDVVLIVNMVDSMYKQLDTYVTLIGIEIWNRGNVFPMENIHQVLEDFSQWKQGSLSQVPHDAAHIFIRSSLISVLGIAYVAGICHPPLDCGVENFQGDSWSLFANTVAHELGHTFGMQHDEEFCFCGESGCVMSTYRVPAVRFTNCSYSDFMKTTLNQGTCLHNHPRPGAVFLLKRCGNGMVENEEECDCGSVHECEQDPCCLLNCKLRPGAACAFGLCCKDCKLMLSGEVCRPKVNECDLPEWCNGTSHQCPEDSYVQNGVSCGVSAYCYQKQCNNHDQQCREIFGKGARSASHACYKEMNSQGNRFGHCGTNGSALGMGRGNGKRWWARRTTTPSILGAPSARGFLFRSGGLGNCKSYAGDAARSLIHLHLRGAPADPGLPPGEPSDMNGRVDYIVTEEEINLTRGPSGLGFNIVGGTDQQYVSNDSGIYVSRIKEDGAAARDGRLQEGDKILSVNGQDLKNLLHQDAVDLFRNAGYAVSLRVQHRLPVQNGPIVHRGEGEPSGIPVAMVLLPVFALTMVAVWAFVRYRKQL